jgi:hypothetical protein
MAELDPNIIFRQEKYSGPTQDELDAKQDMNALRNMLGAGRSIESPEVVNAMMARNPEMGLRLMTNANTMRNDAASLQTKQQEARIARLNGLVPTALAIAKNRDQAAWGQFKTYLQQIDPEAVMGYPDDVNKAEGFVQNFIDAQRAQKGVSQALPFQLSELGGQLGFFDRRNSQYTPVSGTEGQPLVSNPVRVAEINAEKEIQKTQMTTDTSRANAQLSANTRLALQKASTGTHRISAVGGVVVDFDQATGQAITLRDDAGNPLTPTQLLAAQARGEISMDLEGLRQEGQDRRLGQTLTAREEMLDKTLGSREKVAEANNAAAAARNEAAIEGRANLADRKFNNQRDLLDLTNAAKLDQLDAKSRAAAERQFALFEQQAAQLKGKNDAASIQQMAEYRQKAELLRMALDGKLDINDALIAGRLQALDQKAVYDAANLGERLATQRDIAEMNTMSREQIAAMRVAAGGTADKPIIKMVDKKLYEVRQTPEGETILVEPPVGSTGKTLTETAAAKSVAGATVTYRDILKDVDDLAKGGGMVQTGDTVLNNLAATIGGSGIGQTVGGALGTKNQELRDKIVRNSKNLLLNLGLTSTQLNTEKEVQFWLDSVGSVVQSREAFDGAWESFAAKWNAGHPDQPVPATAAELRSGGAAPASTTTSSGIPVQKW